MGEKEQDLIERVAVFRHGLVARISATGMDATHRREETERIVAEDHRIPGSSRTRVAGSTLRDWVRNYNSGGFEALKPSPRADAGLPRALRPEVAEALLKIKETNLELSIRAVIAEAREQGVVGENVPLPVSTVHRLLRRHGFTAVGVAASGAPTDRRRFAYLEAGQLWQSDVMHGPGAIGDDGRRRKVYLLAFLDDATRVITHAEFAFSENTRAFFPIFKRALLRRGLPERLFVDNGANFRSHQLAVLCAKLNVALIHAKVRSPQSKGKIERFFRTVRAQLIARLTEEDTASLEAINRRLGGWIEGEYHHSPHRGLDDDTPLERWARVADGVRYPSDGADFDDLFLFEERRTVNNDRTVSLHGRLFEIDASLIGERVTLRHDPSRPEAPVQVVHEGKLIERARRLDAFANCSIKRHRPSGTPQADQPAEVRRSTLSMKRLGENARSVPEGGAEAADDDDAECS